MTSSGVEPSFSHCQSRGDPTHLRLLSSIMCYGTWLTTRPWWKLKAGWLGHLLSNCLYLKRPESEYHLPVVRMQGPPVAAAAAAGAPWRDNRRKMLYIAPLGILVRFINTAPRSSAGKHSGPLYYNQSISTAVPPEGVQRYHDSAHSADLRLVLQWDAGLLTTCRKLLLVQIFADINSF